ncbi:MAG: ferritin-like domain-containing protein, partial [Halobacteriota archaeon]
MSVGSRVTSDRQLARLLQIGVVLEEVVEARAYHHYQSLSADERELDAEIESLLEHAAEESADHRARLESLIEEIDARSIP